MRSSDDAEARVPSFLLERKWQLLFAQSSTLYTPSCFGRVFFSVKYPSSNQIRQETTVPGVALGRKPQQTSFRVFARLRNEA